MSFDVSTSLFDTAIGVRETSSEADLEEECCSELLRWVESRKEMVT